MTEQHIAVCEALDWRVHDDPEEDYVELEKYSPAGEDFIFGVQKGNFVKNVREYADDFDADEHVELWIEVSSSKYSRSTAGITLARSSCSSP